MKAVAALAVAALVGGCAAPDPSPPADPAPPPGRTIRNEAAGYALDVPPRLTVGGDAAWPFLGGTGFGWHVSYEAAGEDAPFETWAVGAAVLMLQADGPDGSSYCTGPARLEPAANDHGLEAIRIGLVCIAEFRPEDAPPSAETGPWGPVHAVRLPGAGPPRAVFLVPRPVAGDSVFPPVDEGIEDVVRSVRAI